MSFTLIIPAYNEYENLKLIIPVVIEITDDILVIDPGSNDGTYELCMQYGVKFIKQKTKGKGRALIEAVDHSLYEVICFLDADLAHNPDAILSLVKPIIAGDVVHASGSRMLGGSSELFADADHFIRLMGSMVINYLISYKFNYKMTDCQNGFRAIKKSYFRSLKLNSSHTTIEQELVGKTLANGDMILEIPTHEYSRIAGDSKINVLKHGPTYVLSLLSILIMKKISINHKYAKEIKKKYTYNWWENKNN